MKDQDLSALNQRFGIRGELAFRRAPGGLPEAVIANQRAQARICLQGAQVTDFQPRGHQPMLWLSARASFEPGKAIRGGIPLCWPWFGDHPVDPGKPAHGFVRTREWRVLASDSGPGGVTRIRLGLADDSHTRVLWPHRFELTCTVTVGAALEVELAARNRAEQAVVVTGALHTYLRVGDVAALTICGLDGRDYLDKAQGMVRRRQSGPVTIGAETDRIYLDTVADCFVDDQVLSRRIRVAKTGSRSTVIWNPWVHKAGRMPDLGEDGYRQMICVETANAGDDAVTLAPGADHVLMTRINVES